MCKLANFLEIDVFVSIACSENVSKDFKEYYKPVVSLFEVKPHNSSKFSTNPIYQ